MNAATGDSSALHIRAPGTLPLAGPQGTTPLPTGPQVDSSGNLVLSPATLAALSSISTTVRLKDGAPIFHQGDTADFLYVVLKGAVRMSHQLEDGRNQIVAFEWPGDLFGGLVEQDTHLNAANALTDCQLVRLPHGALVRLFEKDPQLQGSFLIEAMSSLRTSQRHLLLVTHQRVIKRVAGFLLECSGQPTCFNTATNTLTLIMDRSDIADYLGTTIETVSRCLGTLEEQGMIQRMDPRHIRLDLTCLRRLLAE